MANPQQLTSVITIKGNVDSSASDLARYIDGLADQTMVLGSTINQLSQPLISLGTEATNLYVEFEDHMKYIQGLGGLTAAQMKEVEKAARAAGETTRYTASDAAQALEDNAVAGLDYKESIALLNTELTAASAGNMELATASSQLLSALAITSTGIDDAQVFVDKWAKTAASSKSDMEGLGEAIERMGATMSYLADGSTEMFTIFGELGNLGAAGAEMGTYARNVLLSLVAPTDKSAEVLANLGYTVEEVEDALDGLDTGDSAALFERLGLEIYDSDTGKLRNVFDILTDLNAALESMTSEERNKAMSTIFNKRTLGYAEGLMRVAASGEWRELFQNIADADGYAQQVADTRESGLGGALRILQSQWEEVQLTIGEHLAPDIQTAAAGLGSIFEWFGSFDEITKTRIIDTLEALAVAGPTLLTVGAALKVLAFAATPTGAISLATIGLAALYKAMEDVANVEFSEQFGTVELDMDELSKHIQQLSSDYEAAYETANTFNSAAIQSFTNYAILKSQFQSRLVTAVITGNALTEDDITQLQSLGQDMLKEVYAGMENTTAGDMEDWNALNEDGSLDDSTYSVIIKALKTDFDSTSKQLESLGGQLYEALMGDWSEEETRAKVQAVLNEIDKVVQEQAQRQADVAAQAEIEKAGWVNQGNAEEYFTNLNTSYENAMTDFDERWASNLATLYIQAQKGEISWDDYSSAKAATEEERTKAAEPYQKAAYAAMQAIFSNSGVSGIFEDIMSLLKGEMLPSEFGAAHRGEEDLVNKTMEAMQPIAEILKDASWTGMNFKVLSGEGLNGLFSSADVMSSITSAFGKLSSAGDWLQSLNPFKSSGAAILNSDGTMWDETVTVQGDTTQLETAIDTVTDEEQQVPVGANMSSIRETIERYRYQQQQRKIVIPVTASPTTSQGDIPDSKGYANGGRATEASIFGEAGAEWAIPEKHTTRTADLLKAAAAASGFTWAELLSTRGGLNGAANSTNIVFSPQITTAGDTGGIKAALEDAQRRFFAQLKRENIVNARVSYSQ